MIDVGSSSRTVIGASSKRCSDGDLEAIGHVVDHRRDGLHHLRRIFEVRKAGHRLPHPAETGIACDRVDDGLPFCGTSNTVFTF